MPASKSPLHAGSARGRDPYTRGPIVGTFVVVVLLHCRRQQANSILPPSPVAGTSCLRHCTRPTAGTAGHRAHATPAVQPATVTLSTLFICQSNNVLHLSLSLSLCGQRPQITVSPQFTLSLASARPPVQDGRQEVSGAFPPTPFLTGGRQQTLHAVAAATAHTRTHQSRGWWQQQHDSQHRGGQACLDKVTPLRQ